jgi:hypothetical protein
MRKLIGFLLLASAFVHAGLAYGHQASLRSDTLTSAVFIDAGIYPFTNEDAVGWQSSYTIRAGVARVGSSALSLYGFIEYYNYSLSGGYFEKGTKRDDIAIYPAISLLRLFFLGAGVCYSHTNPVTRLSVYGGKKYDDYGHFLGDPGGYRGFVFFIVGLKWEIPLTENISIPIGLYTRNPDYSAQSFPVALRAGVLIRMK